MLDCGTRGVRTGGRRGGETENVTEMTVALRRRTTEILRLPGVVCQLRPPTNIFLQRESEQRVKRRHFSGVGPVARVLTYNANGFEIAGGTDGRPPSSPFRYSPGILRPIVAV